MPAVNWDLTWLGWKASTSAKLSRLAYAEWEYMYSKRSPSWSVAFALSHRLTVNGPMDAAQKQKEDRYSGPHSERTPVLLWTCALSPQQNSEWAHGRCTGADCDAWKRSSKSSASELLLVEWLPLGPQSDLCRCEVSCKIYHCLAHSMSSHACLEARRPRWEEYRCIGLTGLDLRSRRGNVGCEVAVPCTKIG